MSALTEEHRYHLRLGTDMRNLEGSEVWAYVVKEIRRLKDGAMSTVLAGVDHDTYRTKIGVISALEDVLRIPGELYDREQTAKDIAQDA